MRQPNGIKINGAPLTSILDAHQKWRTDCDDGKRADLWGADLREADLRGADLQGATLWGADLRRANLREANLRMANLQRADLQEANLREANFHMANLWEANLQRADLQEATLRKADLQRANLREANLQRADLQRARLPDFQICPQEGSFIAYKKVDSGVITLEIPDKAKRTSSLVGRKCRAEYAKCLKGSGVSDRGGRYIEGQFCHPDSYDDDIRMECTHGIHFFMTRDEAEKW